MKMGIDMNKIEFGLNTFGDVAYDDQTKKKITYAQSLRNLVVEGKLADQSGIDVFALGEHHREEYSVSSPETVMAALATVTEQVRLATAVTVLSSDDPIRVYERFATLHGLSNGRVEAMIGRGSFTESFPLFGYDLKNYEELFEEKIHLFSELLKEQPFNWEGKLTQNLNNVQVYPKIENGPLQVSVGVGGSPESVLRTARYGFKLMLAIIGGEPVRFKPYIDLYKKATAQYGQQVLPIGMHSHGVIAETEKEAKEIAWQYIKPSMDKIGRERGWGAMSREQFDFEIENGAYYVGTPEQVAHKIAKNMTAVGVERFDLVYGAGGQLQKDRFKTIELYGTQVVPLVKELLRNGEYE